METSILRVGPVGVYSLGLALGLAFLAAGAAGRSAAVRSGITPSEWWRTIVTGMLLAVAGARIAYVLPDWTYYLTRPLELVSPPLDGLSFRGGVAVGLAYLAYLAFRRGDSFLAVGDLFALPYLAGVMVVCLVWSTPVYLTGIPAWAGVVADFAYVTGLYLLLWWVWVRSRQPGFSGQLFLAALGGDALFRLLWGSWSAAFAPGGWRALAAVHATRLAAAAVALIVYALAGRRVRSVLPPPFVPFQRPLSRWVGWLTAYGFLVSLLAAARAAKGL